MLALVRLKRKRESFANSDAMKQSKRPWILWWLVVHVFHSTGGFVSIQGPRLKCGLPPIVSDKEISFELRTRLDTSRTPLDHSSSVVVDENINDSHEKDDYSIGFYIHIPYCRRRCRYCNFDIVPIGQKRNSSSQWNQGFDALDRNYSLAVLQELQTLFQQEKEQYKDSNNNFTISLRSIYFGGGTPSLAPVSTIQAILEAILVDSMSPFVAEEEIEITMEMDPGTFDLEQLQALRDLGVNRISLGVQSFDDSVLNRLGRQHSVSDIWESIRLLQLVYGDRLNYSIDLISGLPGVSLAMWSETLYTAMNGLTPPPDHLSVYDLQIESGTVFGNWYGGNDNDQFNDKKNRSKAGTWHATKGTAPSTTPPLPSDDETAFQYQYTAGYLHAKGFEHYEVSSYARCRGRNIPTRSPSRSKHNQVYWGYHTQWYAVGLGATSFVRGHIVARPSTFFDYVQWAQGKTEQNSFDQNSTNSVDTGIDRLLNVVLKRLRTVEGLNLTWVQQQFGHDEEAAIVRGAQLGLELGLAIKETSTTSTILRLVNPQGFLFSNSILSSIFFELEDENE